MRVGQRSLTALAAALAVAACSRLPTSIARPGASPWPAERHCWWAAYRTGASPDSVAARFARAFVHVGLADGLRGAKGDTAWTQAGPTMLSDSARKGVFAARVVALRRGDSTAFRLFVGLSKENLVNGKLLIGMCGDLLRAAAVRAVVPRQQEADDSLPLWRRRH